MQGLKTMCTQKGFFLCVARLQQLTGVHAETPRITNTSSSDFSSPNTAPQSLNDTTTTATKAATATTATERRRHRSRLHRKDWVQNKRTLPAVIPPTPHILPASVPSLLPVPSSPRAPHRESRLGRHRAAAAALRPQSICGALLPPAVQLQSLLPAPARSASPCAYRLAWDAISQTITMVIVITRDLPFHKVQCDVRSALTPLWQKSTAFKKIPSVSRCNILSRIGIGFRSMTHV